MSQPTLAVFIRSPEVHRIVMHHMARIDRLVASKVHPHKRSFIACRCGAASQFARTLSAEARKASWLSGMDDGGWDDVTETDRAIWASRAASLQEAAGILSLISRTDRESLVDHDSTGSIIVSMLGRPIGENEEINPALGFMATMARNGFRMLVLDQALSDGGSDMLEEDYVHN